jgi:hypothetical protein
LPEKQAKAADSKTDTNQAKSGTNPGY